jgi:uncharacterized protein YkwD
MIRRCAVLLVLACGLGASLDAVAAEAGDNGVVSGTSRSGLAALTPRAFTHALLEETNRVRRAHGRRPLRARSELEAAADDQAAFMALRMQVQHGSFLPGQSSARDRVARHGLEGVAVAENVASTTLSGPEAEFSVREIAARLVEQWMESPGHRATLLDRRLTHFGGSVRLARLGSQWTAYGAQVFLIASPPFGRVSA